MDSQSVEHIANMFGYKVAHDLIPILACGPYLEYPRALSFWGPIIEKIDRRLQSWNNSHICKGGRLTLILATLSKLPIYYISLFNMPIIHSHVGEKRRNTIGGK